MASMQGLAAAIAFTMAIASSGAGQNMQVVNAATPASEISVLDRLARLDVRGVSLFTALAGLSEQSGVGIAFSPTLLRNDNRRVTCRCEDVRVRHALDRMLGHTELSYSLLDDQVVITPRASKAAPAPAIQSSKYAFAAMHFGSVLARSVKLGWQPRQVGSITGRVIDAATGEGLSGVGIMVEGTEHGAQSALGGRYRIDGIPPGTYTVAAVTIGYARATREVTVPDGGTVDADFSLSREAIPLDELVVTGTMMPTEMRAISSPISVITAQDIERKNVTNLVDLLRGEIPGVLALNRGASSDYHNPVYVRGNAGWSTGDYVKLYIDGIEVAGSHRLMTIDPNSIERIEMVRGPAASTIYGSEASSGVLQIFTKKGRSVLERPTIEAKSSFGVIESDYQREGASTPLTQEHSVSLQGGGPQISYNAGGTYMTVGEWVRAYDSKTLSFSGGLRAVQGPFTIEVTGLWSNRSYRYPFPPPTYQRWEGTDCTQCSSSYMPTEQDRFTQNTQALTVTYQATEKWRHQLSLGENASRTLWYEPEPVRSTPADTFTFLYQNEQRKRSIRYNTAYDAELAPGATARLTLGADYWNFEEQGTYANNLLSAYQVVTASPESEPSFTNARFWNAGYLALAELGFADQLFVTIAGRVDDNSRFGDDYGRAFSPRFGLSYSRDFGSFSIKGRAGWGKGTRPPPADAVTGSASSSTIVLPNPEVGPEEKVGWDAGIEFYWGQTGSLLVTRFDEEGRNLIQQVDIDPASTPRIAQFQNIGRVASSGWEIEGTVNLGPVSLDANYAFIDNVIDELSNEYTSNPASNYAVGDRIWGIPKHSGGATLTARLWNGSASLNMTALSDYYYLDRYAYFDYVYGGDPYRGAYRDYIVQFTDPLLKWNFRADRAFSDRWSAFVRIDNLSNNQEADLFGTDVTQGRTTVVGLRLVY